MESAERNDAKEAAAMYQVLAGLREVESGDQEQALLDANSALKLAPDPDVRALAAVTLALAGDTAKAERLAAELDKTFPRNTLVQRYRLPAIRSNRVATERPTSRYRTPESGGSTGTRETQVICCRSIYEGRGVSDVAGQRRCGL